MDIEQSNKPRMSGRGDGGALVRVERRWNWSDEKLAILKETTAPGAIVSAVARRLSVGTGQLYTWRMEQERAELTAAQATVEAQNLRIEKLEHRVARLLRVRPPLRENGYRPAAADVRGGRSPGTGKR